MSASPDKQILLALTLGEVEALAGILNETIKAYGLKCAMEVVPLFQKIDNQVKKQLEEKPDSSKEILKAGENVLPAQG